MIDVALQFLCNEVNTWLFANTGSGIMTKLTSIVDDSGKFGFEQESIGVNVVSIEEERIVKTQLPQNVFVNGQNVTRQPDLKINVYVMFAANFKVYEEALKYLSLILVYFQGQRSFTPTEFPALDPSIEKILLDLQSPTFEQWNQIWGCNGGRQLPCILYKLRLIVIQPETPLGVGTPILKIGNVLANK
jgi:hypothetical protein